MLDAKKDCRGLTQQPATKHHTATRSLPPGGMGGERIGRVKVRKLMNLDKDSLTGKAKAVHPNEAEQGIHSLLPNGRQGFGHLQESRALSCITVTREDKRYHLNIPLFLLPSAFYC